MVDLPWRRDADDDEASDPSAGEDPDALIVCDFQDGTLVVFEDRVVIERISRSRFDDKTVPMEDIAGVDYAKGITIGYLQLELVGVEPDPGGWFSDPVNENTLHFGRRDRDCATEARDEILARARE